MILGIDHVGVAVSDAAAARETFARLAGQDGSALEDLPAQGVRVCFVPASAPTRLEVLEPLDPQADDSAVARFLARRGEGLHHICYAVDDIRAELARLAAGGFTLIDREPRAGHGGLVAFVHPKSAHGVLLELLQRDP